MSNLGSAKFLRVVISEQFEVNGEKRRRQTQVGTAWLKKTKEGEEYVSIRITPGLSVSGDLSVFQHHERDEKPAGREPARGGKR